nr:hypothetical protein [Tanacetum cinerariifolium]
KVILSSPTPRLSSLFLTRMIASAVCRNGLPKMRGTLLSSSICRITKSTGFKVFSKSDAYNEYGIRQELVLNDGKAFFLQEGSRDLLHLTFVAHEALSSGGSDLVCLEEDGSTSFSALSTSSSLSSWIMVV